MSLQKELSPIRPMARIFDNIDQDLLTTLRATMKVSHRSNFCVGYQKARFGVRPIGRGTDIYGATHPTERAKLRAELDGLVANLYCLTEVEFAHVLSTFSPVAEQTKITALNARRNVERGLIQ